MLAVWLFRGGAWHDAAMVEYGRSGAHGRLVVELGTAIVNGALTPGDDLDPVALGRRFGVSRTVVREALRVLTAKGLVGARPRRGTFVAARERWVLLDPDVLRWRFGEGFDAEFLDQLGEVRLTVEPTVARLAAVRRTDRDLAALEDALQAMRAASGQGAAQHVEADLAFHDALLRASHNELLVQMSTVIEVGLRLRDQFVHDVLTRESTDKHADVLLAVRRQRPKAAESAMRAVIERSMEDVETAKTIGRPPVAAGAVLEGADRPASSQHVGVVDQAEFVP
jgi:GntR family transcriptional regulator, galactonate operon transcriptional repressor